MWSFEFLVLWVDVDSLFFVDKDRPLKLTKGSAPHLPNRREWVFLWEVPFIPVAAALFIYCVDR